jgi:hypothetical protein
LAFFFFFVPVVVSVGAEPLDIVSSVEVPVVVASVEVVGVVVVVESVDDGVVVVEPVVVLSVVVDDGADGGVEGVVCADTATGTASPASKSIRNLIMIWILIQIGGGCRPVRL